MDKIKNRLIYILIFILEVFSIIRQNRASDNPVFPVIEVIIMALCAYRIFYPNRQNKN